MKRPSSFIARSVVVGVAATAVMDAAGELIRRSTGVQPLNLGMVGRWVGHMAHGQFRHANIAEAEPVSHERALGWLAHYSIGTAFAGVLIAARPGWARRPTLAPALATGLATTAAPWLVMQPAFGMGLAASRTPEPALARWRSLRAHGIYGLGLYLAGTAVRRAGSARP